MAYKDIRVTIKVPQDLADIIMTLDLSGKSLTERAVWMLKQQLKRLQKAGEKAPESK